MKLSDLRVAWRPARCPHCQAIAQATYRDDGTFAGRIICTSCAPYEFWHTGKDPVPLHQPEEKTMKKTIETTISRRILALARGIRKLGIWISPSVLVLTVVASSGCGLFEDGGALSWPKVAQCGPTGEDLFGVVSRIILEDRGKQTLGEHAVSQLEDLAKTKGVDAVACVISNLISQWQGMEANRDPGEHDQARLDGIQKGQHFLASRGVEEVER